MVFGRVPMMSEATLLESRLSKVEQDNRRLKLTVGTLLLVMAAVPLVGAAAPEQDLTGRFLFLATARTGTMQRELDEAAAAGYRILTGSPTSGHEMTLVLEKVVTPPDTYQYLLLATTRTGTMQRELDEAAADGFRLLPATMISKTEIIGNLLGIDAREIVMIMERSPNSSRRYQYMLLATNFTSTLQAEMAQAVENGYEVVGMVSRDEHILILERSNQEETQRLREALEEETRRLKEESGRSARAPVAERGPVSGTGWVTDSGYIVTVAVRPR